MQKKRSEESNKSVYSIPLEHNGTSVNVLIPWGRKALTTRLSSSFFDGNALNPLDVVDAASCAESFPADGFDEFVPLRCA